MVNKSTKGEIIRLVVFGVVAILVVTVASYVWRIPQEFNSQVVTVVYATSIILMGMGAFVIFRRFVRRCYAQNRRLTPFAFYAQAQIWGLFFAFPCIYQPINWAWTRSAISKYIPLLGGVGWACVGVGLVSLAIALGGLGIPRSCGRDTGKLEIRGLYRLTRNPQLMGGALLVMGYVLIWPSWYAVGWVVLFAVMTHWMVLSEEEFLRSVHSEAYHQYCQRVPRYLGLRR